VNFLIGEWTGSLTATDRYTIGDGGTNRCMVTWIAKWTFVFKSYDDANATVQGTAVRQDDYSAKYDPDSTVLNPSRAYYGHADQCNHMHEKHTTINSDVFMKKRPQGGFQMQYIETDCSGCTDFNPSRFSQPINSLENEQLDYQMNPTYRVRLTKLPPPPPSDDVSPPDYIPPPPPPPDDVSPPDYIPPAPQPPSLRSN
jgi:hypothetical protein